MKHRLFMLKMVCFTVVAALVIHGINMVLNPKYLYDQNWPTTQTFTDFYQLEKDSIDVLFFGSSHCVNAFSPVELYEEYGISSYNLGSEQQNLLISYYWLKEALRFQSPQAVVLDTYLLFYYNGEEALNSAESTQRKAIDYMKWSSVKREAVASICQNDENQSLLSYYLTNIRFHTRWTALNEDDFTYGFLSSHQALMGYSALSRACQDTSFVPFQSGSSTEAAQPIALMEEYLDRMVALCEENGIDLILVKTPTTAGTVQKYNYLNQYAEGHHVQYIDFNEETLYTEIEYDFPNDNNDGGHLNIWGAEKVTDYLGEVLKNQYNIPSRKSAAHEELLTYYAERKKDCELKYVTDFSAYLDLICDSRYAVFISIKDEGTSALNDSLKEKLALLGTTVSFEDKYRYSYYAVINGDAYDEEIRNESLSSSGTIRDGKVIYSITSAGYSCGNQSSILIDGTEYSLNQRGMNIVVYCLDSKKVIDQVCFDTCGDGSATRE